MYTIILNTKEETYNSITEVVERFAEVVEHAFEHGIIHCSVYEGNNRLYAYNVK